MYYSFCFMCVTHVMCNSWTQFIAMNIIIIIFHVILHTFAKSRQHIQHIQIQKQPKQTCIIQLLNFEG